MENPELKEGGQRRSRTFITTLGIVIIVLGAIPLINYLLIASYILRAMLAKRIPPDRIQPLVIWTGISIALPLAKVIGGVWLLRLRAWARTLSVTVFVIEFILVFVSAIAFCVDYGNIPAVVQAEAAGLVQESMLPNYIFACVGLLFVSILSRKSVKELFAVS